MLQVTPNCTKAGPCQKSSVAVCLDQQVAANAVSPLSAVIETRLGTERPSAGVTQDSFFSASNSRPVDSLEVTQASLLMKVLVTLLVLVHTAAKIPGVTMNTSESKFVIGHESIDFLYLGLSHDHKNMPISHS